MARPVLTGIDLNLVVVLDALLQEASVTGAGHRLSLSQPAVSGSLRRLRQVFDDELLVREGRSMRLTPFAEQLAPVVTQVVAEFEHLFWSRPAFDPAHDE